MATAVFFHAHPGDEAIATGETLAELLRDEGATVLTCCDDHGGYGHPDHIQVHGGGHRAAQLAGEVELFGTEWYVRIGHTPAEREVELQGLPL